MSSRRSRTRKYATAAEALRVEHERREEVLLERAKLLALCEHSLEDRAAELVLCANDIFYWIDNYVWLQEPRFEQSTIPCVLYDYQRDIIREIIEAIESTLGSVKKLSLLIEKTRDMGLSWLLVIIAVWYWRFRNKTSLFGSRKEALVDKHGDMKTLLEKARFVIRNMPEWMLPEGFDSVKDMGFLLIRNPQGGAITGEATCPDFGRGDRKLFIVFDEFASWAYDQSAAQSASQSSNVLIFISTPKGPFNKFARMARGDQEERTKPKIIRCHWVEHPVKAAGLEVTEDGRPTSEWYREQCKEMTPDEIAQELDINYISSMKGLVFEDYIPEWHRKKSLRPVEGLPIIRVWDPGLTTFVLFMQVDNYRRVLCLKEFTVDGADIHDVADEVLAISYEYFNGFQFIDCGDPAGTRRQSGSYNPEFEVLLDDYQISVETDFLDTMQAGLRVKSRIVAIHNKLGETCAATKTHSLLIDPDGCPNLDRAMSEGYRYKVDQYTKRVIEIIEDNPPFDDAVDCLGMGILYKLGLATNKQSSKTVQVAKNVIQWRGRDTRSMRSRYR